MRLELIALTLIASIAACGGEDPADSTPTPSASPSPTPSPSPSPTVAPGPVCERGVLEADFELFAPFGGPGVDPATGKLRPSAGEPYIISSTYIRLRPEPAAQQAFGELMGPIAGALQQQPGLAAVLLGSSMTLRHRAHAHRVGLGGGDVRVRRRRAARGGDGSGGPRSAAAGAWPRTGWLRAPRLSGARTGPAAGGAEWKSVLPQLRAYDGPLY
jgi:hypothetical protein